MTLIGFRRLGDDDDSNTPWIAPSDLRADQLKQALDLIKRAEFDPPSFDNGKNAEAQIRRVSAAANRRRVAYDDESDNGIGDDEELFPAGGPTPMTKSDALAQLKKTRRKRRGSEEPDALSDEQLQARRRARQETELEKQRRIKSELFVHDSDDEDDVDKDRAFFEREERQRENVRKGMSAATPASRLAAKAMSQPNNKGKRRATQIESEDSDAAEEPSAVSSQSSRRPAGSDVEELPSDMRAASSKRARLDTEDLDSAPGSPAPGPEDVKMADIDDDDEEEVVPVARRPRKTYGVFIEDSSEED